MNPDLTPDAELRTAAATLRRLAAVVPPGPWVHRGDRLTSGADHVASGWRTHLDYIAAMNLTVGAALVDLLDAAAERMKSTGAVEAPDGRVYDAVVGRHHHYWRLALAVARAVNAKEDTRTRDYDYGTCSGCGREYTLTKAGAAALAAEKFDHLEQAGEQWRERAEKAETERHRLTSILLAALNEHRENRIYDLCGHNHVEGAPGVVDTGDYLTCEDGYESSICSTCCSHRGQQTSTCLSEHDGTNCWPCPTRRALDGDQQ